MNGKHRRRIIREIIGGAIVGMIGYLPIYWVTILVLHAPFNGLILAIAESAIVLVACVGVILAHTGVIRRWPGIRD